MDWTKLHSFAIEAFFSSQALSLTPDCYIVTVSECFLSTLKHSGLENAWFYQPGATYNNQEISKARQESKFNPHPLK